MSSIAALEHALTEVFESNQGMNFEAPGSAKTETSTDDIRVIRTDLSLLAMNRPSTKE